MKSFWIAPMILSLAVLADVLDQQYDAKVVRHVDGLVNAIKYEYSKAIDQEFDNTQSSDEKEKTLGNSKHFMPPYGMYDDDMYPYYGYGGNYGGYGGFDGGYGGYYGGMDGNPYTMWKRSINYPPNDQLKQEIKAEFDDQVLKAFRKGALDIVQTEYNDFKVKGGLIKRAWNDNAKDSTAKAAAEVLNAALAEADELEHSAKAATEAAIEEAEKLATSAKVAAESARLEAEELAKNSQAAQAKASRLQSLARDAEAEVLARKVNAVAEAEAEQLATSAKAVAESARWEAEELARNAKVSQAKAAQSQKLARKAEAEFLTRKAKTELLLRKAKVKIPRGKVDAESATNFATRREKLMDSLKNVANSLNLKKTRGDSASLGRIGRIKMKMRHLLKSAIPGKKQKGKSIKKYLSRDFVLGATTVLSLWAILFFFSRLFMQKRDDIED